MARRRKGFPIDGWLVLDKPGGVTSAGALARVLALTGALKGGHAGTLDPLATGVLPIALGEATKTVGYVMDGTKRYRFTLRFGEARATDDAEGAVVATSPVRPDDEAIRAALPSCGGTISQTPPRFAALKLGGRRAYAIARSGGDPDLAPRAVRLDEVALTGRPDADHAVFELGCGKGFYVRAFARDLATRLGTVGHVAALRRLAAGPFTEAQAISLDKLTGVVHSPALIEHLLPIETALDDIPALPLSDATAARLRCGARVPVPGTGDGPVRVVVAGRVVALARVGGGEAQPVRVFNLQG
ncbi:MAG: tRNA pseudouridine(55) synthase TruB [Alphaproteobacteria bacterium]